MAFFIFDMWKVSGNMFSCIFKDYLVPLLLKYGCCGFNLGNNTGSYSACLNDGCQNFKYRRSYVPRLSMFTVVRHDTTIKLGQNACTGQTNIWAPIRAKCLLVSRNDVRSVRPDFWIFFCYGGKVHLVFPLLNLQNCI